MSYQSIIYNMNSYPSSPRFHPDPYIPELTPTIKPPSSCRSVREQEEQANAMRSENFKLKLRIYFMEQQQQQQQNSLSDQTDVSIDSEADRLQRENLSLRIDNELMRAELQEKQALICEAAEGMEHMDQMLLTERRQHEHRVEVMQDEMDRAQLKSAKLLSSERHNRLSALEDTIGNQRNQLEFLELQIENKDKMMTEMTAKFVEMESNSNRAIYELESLKEELSNKTKLNNELEMFRSYAKKNFAFQLDNAKRENSKLRKELAEIRHTIVENHLAESGFEQNLRVISEQSRQMKELHLNIDSKQQSVQELRTELAASDCELRHLRSQNAQLVARVQSHHCDNCPLIAHPSFRQLPVTIRQPASAQPILPTADTTLNQLTPRRLQRLRRHQQHMQNGNILQRFESSIWLRESRAATSTPNHGNTPMDVVVPVKSANTLHDSSLMNFQMLCCRFSAGQCNLHTVGKKAAEVNIAAQLQEPKCALPKCNSHAVVAKKSLVGSGLRLLFDRIKN